MFWDLKRRSYSFGLSIRVSHFMSRSGKTGSSRPIAALGAQNDMFPGCHSLVDRDPQKAFRISCVLRRTTGMHFRQRDLVRLCVCVCLCIYIYIHTYINLCIYLYTCISFSMYLSLSLSFSLYVYVYVYTYTYTYIHILVYILFYICVYLSLCLSISYLSIYRSVCLSVWSVWYRPVWCGLCVCLSVCA